MRRIYYTQSISAAILLFTLTAFVDSSLVDQNGSTETKDVKDDRLLNFLRSDSDEIDGKLTDAELKEAERKVFELNPEKLRDLWHHAMVKTLLKSKAKQIYAKLPFVEQVVYKQCAQNAKSLSHLAKCVVQLLNERDRRRQEEEIQRRKEEAEAEKRRMQEEARLALERQAIQRNRVYSTVIRTELRPLPYRPGQFLPKMYSTNSKTEPRQRGPYHAPFAIHPTYKTSSQYAPLPATELNIGSTGMRANSTLRKSLRRYGRRRIRPQLRTMQQYGMEKKRFADARNGGESRSDFGFDYYNPTAEYNDRTTTEDSRERYEQSEYYGAYKRTRFARSSFMSIDQAYEAFLEQKQGGTSEGDVAYLANIPDDSPVQHNSVVQAIEPIAQPRPSFIPSRRSSSPDVEDPLKNIITEVMGKASIQPIRVPPIKPLMPSSLAKDGIFPSPEEGPSLALERSKERTSKEDHGILRNMTVRIVNMRPSINHTGDMILSIPSRNLIGLPRYMQINQAMNSSEKKSRKARSVPSLPGAEAKPASQDTSKETSRSTPNLSFPALAAKYLRNLIGGPSSSLPANSTIPKSSTAKLQMIREHFERVNKCNQYFQLMSDENKGIFKQLGISMDVRDPHVSASKEEDILKDVVDMLNDFTEENASGKKKSTKWSILSPRFFSMLPNAKKTQAADFVLDKGKLLSPNMLSFQGDGFFSIPELFNIVTADQTSQHVMMDLIMEVSGASTALDDAISKLEPEILHTKNVQFPLVQQMSKLDHSWLQIKKSYTEEQQRQIKESGYAFLEPDQLKTIYGEESGKLRVNITEYGNMSKEEREARIERDIRNLAIYGDEKGKDLLKWGRKKRSVNTHSMDSKEDITRSMDSGESKEEDTRKWYERGGTVTKIKAVRRPGNSTSYMEDNYDTTQGPHIIQQQDPGDRTTVGPPDDFSLQHDTHTESSVHETTTDVHGAPGHVPDMTDHNEHEEHHRVNGVLFETLEPFAFTNLINHGAALEAITLSPHAFIGEIITPEALILSTLSPRAFIATVLSPAALVARILSPTAFRAEVMAPRALYTWILSPEALIAEVLTPHFLEPRILSGESLIIEVLSPRMLSPNILSPESFGVLVLSPNILSPRILSEEKYLVEVLSPHILGGPHSKEEEEESVISIGEGHKEHEGEEPGPNHPAHGPEAAWDLNGGGQPPPPHTHEQGHEEHGHGGEHGEHEHEHHEHGDIHFNLG